MASLTECRALTTCSISIIVVCRVNPVTNIDRGNLKLHIGRSGKWRSYSQFEVLTAEYVVKWIKRRIDSKSSPHFTIEVKSDTEVTFKVHKKVQFNQ